MLPTSRINRKALPCVHLQTLHVYLYPQVNHKCTPLHSYKKDSLPPCPANAFTYPPDLVSSSDYQGSSFSVSTSLSSCSFSFLHFYMCVYVYVCLHVGVCSYGGLMLMSRIIFNCSFTFSIKQISQIKPRASQYN